MTGEKYDLCICVEVAEHLQETHAGMFINSLCQYSDVVLFSAAIQLQDGRHHLNQQWQSYWVDLFDANGCECLDIVRPAIWENNEVAWWYRQNIFLFVRRDSDSAGLINFRHMASPILNIVYPEHYKNKASLSSNPAMLSCLKCMVFYCRRLVRKLIGKMQ